MKRPSALISLLRTPAACAAVGAVAFTVLAAVAGGLVAAETAGSDPQAAPGGKLEATAKGKLKTTAGGELEAIAWLRVERETPDAQEYRGVPYVWLGRTALRLTIDVEPGPGHVLELSWGAKGDVRRAAATINGRELKLEQGGYDDFRPLRVSMPEGLEGKRYEVILIPDGERAAFIAAFRLLAPAKPGGGGAQDPKAPHRMKIESIAPPRPEAFPEKRPFWDRDPPPPLKPLPDKGEEEAFRAAEKNGRLANEQLFRSRKFVDGWLRQADPRSGLIPRNLGVSRDIWNAQDSAADNYPFMVLTSALTDRPLFEGRMLEMLRAETKLTSRVDRLPDTWSFSKQAFASPEVNLDAVIFGSAEYIKDGLLPLTEWLGPSPWSERMVGIADDILKNAPVETPFGRIPSTNVEVCGDILQALSRLFWLTGDRKYLEGAMRLGDHYLLGGHHPTRDFTSLRFRDHGCEIVAGLSELYVAVRFADPAKKKEYEGPVHEMFDRILEVGRDERGMLYNSVNPRTGEHDAGICDTWGYNYNGLYAVYLIDGTQAYRESVRKVLSRLKELASYHWGVADEYADSIEGAINLYNREPVAEAVEWIDGEIRDMWSVQKPDGIIEGWHGDGNIARTGIMYALWKTQGLTVEPWREDLCFGAVRIGDGMRVSLRSGEPWKGKLIFDKPRHRLHLRLPIDYPRINQFPEWFTVESGKEYAVTDFGTGLRSAARGEDLQRGLPLKLKPGEELRLGVTPQK